MEIEYKNRCEIAEERLKKALHRAAWNRDYFVKSKEYEKASICSDIIYSVDD